MHSPRAAPADSYFAQFRTRTFRYSPKSLKSPSDDDDDDEKGKTLSKVNEGHLARERFTERVQKIWAEVMESDVYVVRE